MYNNTSHLMISGCFISVLCIKMQRSSNQKRTGQERRARPRQSAERLSFMVGNIKQPSLLRDEVEVILEGCAEGNGVDLPPAECFYEEPFASGGFLYGKLS